MTTQIANALLMNAGPSPLHHQLCWPGQLQLLWKRGIAGRLVDQRAHPSGLSLTCPSWRPRHVLYCTDIPLLKSL